MPERKCICGETLGITRRVKCFKCREKDDLLRKQLARQKKIEGTATTAKEAQSVGRVLLHSCLSNILDPAPQTCRCRRWITTSEAQKFVSQGRCLDWETRQSFFVGRAIVEAGKYKLTPRGAGIERAHIFHGIQDITINEKTPAEKLVEVEDLRRRILVDKLERGEEERYRWQTWQELQQEWLASVTNEYSAEAWDASEKASRGDLALRTIIREQRSSGGFNA